MDIVERLRRIELLDSGIAFDAADEIERLREENDTLKAMVINLLAKEFEHVKVIKPKTKKSRSALQQKKSK